MFLVRHFENVVHMELLSSCLIPKVSEASMDIVNSSCLGSSELDWEDVQGENSCTVSTGDGQRRGPLD